jgi:insertion element IS1 protein InsB
MKRQAELNDQIQQSDLSMIQTIITYECPHCGSLDLVKNGHDYKGAQKYHCKACKRYGTLNSQRGYTQQRREQVQRALLERVSLRGIGRIFQMSRRTVMRWLHEWRQHLTSLDETLLPMQAGDVLELDELWSFVGNKTNQQWLWLALCRRTRQVVAYYVGNRSETSALHLWRHLPRDYAACHSFSDQLAAYAAIFDHKRHQSVPKSAGQTNHVERWFNTLRQRLARFTRKTLAFSKTQINHEAILHMFILDHNLSCIS